MNGAGRTDAPVWLLDPDGVLNAMSRPGWSAPPARRYAYADGVQFKLRWAPVLLEEVRDLIGSDVVEVRWATSWVMHIGQIARAMALLIAPDERRGLQPADITTIRDWLTATGPAPTSS